LGSVRGYQRVLKPYFEPFLPIFRFFFCLLLQFSTLESCYILFTISLEYPSAFVHSCSPGKIQNQGLSGGIRGYVNPILSHFCPFFSLFCLFLPFSTLELFYNLFITSLVYLSAYINSCCPGKIQNWGLSGGIRGYVNLILSYFCLFSEIFYLFLQFSTLELCFIWLLTSLKYPSAYVYSCCPGKIQNRGLSGGIRGYVNLILSQFCLFF